MTQGRHLIGQGADLICDRLNHILNRVCRNDSLLWIEQDGDNYVVADLANNDEVMLRSPDLSLCERFVRAFITKHPETRLDESFALAGLRRAAARLGEPTAVEVASLAAPVSQAAVMPPAEPASPSTFSWRVDDDVPVLDNVVPIRGAAG